MDEPFSPTKVKSLITVILQRGVLGFSKHAQEEMAKDNLTEVDVRNTLRGGVPQEGEFERGSWRYRIQTKLMAAVIAFRSELHAVVVTAWRNKR